MKTTRDVLKELDITPEYREFKKDKDTLTFNLQLMTLCKDEDKCEEILSSPDAGFILNVMSKRVEALNLEEHIAPSAILISAMFDLDNPGKAVMYIIDVLDWAVKNETKATYNDVCMGVYPNGFYTDETCLAIIDKVHKPKLATHSTIY